MFVPLQDLLSVEAKNFCLTSEMLVSTHKLWRLLHLDRGITVRTGRILCKKAHRRTAECKLCRLPLADSGTMVRTWLRLVLAVQWVQTKEEWDREKVYLAELGYVPDEADPEVCYCSARVPLFANL